MSIDAINDLRPDVIVVPITTRPGPLRVAIPDRPATTGLREASFAECETVGPLHKSSLKARVGRLPPETWSAVEAGLCRVLGLPEPA